ncbi:kinase-like domain-containing protein [Hyaloraphidium curvatum]|nr:kinase-like domain-containing protein [Hyaloraphidium curvatum]
MLISPDPPQPDRHGSPAGAGGSPATPPTPATGGSGPRSEEPDDLRIEASKVVYDETQKLGAGGFGVVYQGVLFDFNEVAVKVIKGNVDERTRADFKKEVRIWQKLRHKHVLPLMAYCEDPPMMISALVREGNLRTYLSKRNWDLKIGVKLLKEVALGMAYLHSLPTPVLHGDLKAYNILVDDGRALITDFGMSRLRDRVALTMSGQGWGGTPGFMVRSAGRWCGRSERSSIFGRQAPELYTQSLKPPADVYAFAMVAYEVVSKGLFPFYEARGNQPMLVRVEGKRPSKPEGANEELWAIMEDCWKERPEDRPRFPEVYQRLQALEARL